MAYTWICALGGALFKELKYPEKIAKIKDPHKFTII